MVEIYISAYQVEIGKPLANDVLHWSSLERKSSVSFFYNFAKVRELSQDGENDIHLLKKIHVLFYVFEALCALSLTGKIGMVVWLFFWMDGFSAFSGQFSLHCPCSNARLNPKP